MRGSLAMFFLLSTTSWRAFVMQPPPLSAVACTLFHRAARVALILHSCMTLPRATAPSPPSPYYTTPSHHLTLSNFPLPAAVLFTYHPVACAFHTAHGRYPRRYTALLPPTTLRCLAYTMAMVAKTPCDTFSLRRKKGHCTTSPFAGRGRTASMQAPGVFSMTFPIRILYRGRARGKNSGRRQRHAHARDRQWYKRVYLTTGARYLRSTRVPFAFFSCGA